MFPKRARLPVIVLAIIYVTFLLWHSFTAIH